MIAELLADLQPAIDLLVGHGYQFIEVRSWAPEDIFARASAITVREREMDGVRRAEGMLDQFWAYAGARSPEAQAVFAERVEFLLGQPSHFADPDAEPDIDALERAGVLTEENPDGVV